MLNRLLLAAGVLPISMAWGGRQESLTSGLRVANVVSGINLGLFAYIIRRRAGLTDAEGIWTWVRVLAWLVTAHVTFDVVSNPASQRTIEQIVFAPINPVLTNVCLVVSMSRR